MRSIDSQLSKCLFAVLLVGVMVGPGHFAMAQKSEDAARTVESLHNTLIEVMKLNAASQMPGRLKKMKPVIDQVFDIQWIAANSIGKDEWGKLNDVQKKKLVETLKAYTVSSYVTRFGDFGGEAFKTVGHKLKGPSALVKTEFKTAKGATKDFFYQLKSTNNKWVVINVLVDGISDLAQKRAEYGDIIKKEGVDSLIKKLNQKTEEQLNQKSK